MSARIPEPYYHETDTRHIFKRCPLCDFRCRTYTQFYVHIDAHHTCEHCSHYFAQLSTHVCAARPAQDQLGRGSDVNGVEESKFRVFASAHRGAVISYQYTVPEELVFNDVADFFSHVNDDLKLLLQRMYREHETYTFTMLLTVFMEQEQDDTVSVSAAQRDAPRQKMFYFYSRTKQVLSADMIPQNINDGISEILGEKHQRTERGSKWFVVRIESLEVKTAEIQRFAQVPLDRVRVGSYIEMPFRKHGYLSFKNRDEKCFKYCLAARLFWDEAKTLNAERKLLGKRPHDLRHHSTWKKYFDRIDWRGINTQSFDMYEGLPIFEENNNVAVNVFTHQKNREKNHIRPQVNEEVLYSCEFIPCSWKKC